MDTDSCGANMTIDSFKFDPPDYDIILSNGESVNARNGWDELIRKREIAINRLLGDNIPKVYGEEDIVTFIRNTLAGAGVEKPDLFLDGSPKDGDCIVKITSCSSRNLSH